jgi:hypothetical protein
MGCRTFRLDDQAKIDSRRFTSHGCLRHTRPPPYAALFHGAFEFRPQGLTTPVGAPKEELMNFTGLPLTSTFIHLPGIRLRRERELWNKGILDWHQ